MRPSSRHALARRLDQRFASAYALTKCDFICIVSLFIASVIAFATLGYRRVIPMPPCTTPRAIIIGDVHGCARELRTLLPILEKVERVLRPRLLVVKNAPLKRLVLKCRLVDAAEGT